MFCSKQVMIGTSKNIWGFDPRSVGGCQLWFDAADSSTVTLNGSAVSSWKDKSINGYSVSQSTSGNQPTYATNLLNGLPGIQLSSQKYLEQFGSNMPNFTSSTSTTVLIVAKNGSTMPSSGWNMLNTCWFNSSGTGINRYHFTFANGATNGVTLYANGALVGITTAVSLGSNAIVGFTASSTGNSINVNGTLTTYSGTSLPSTNNSTFFRFGDDRASYVSDVNVYEFLGFDTTLTTSQRQQVEGYLAQKWGLQSLLPSTQPYYSLKPHLRAFQPTDIAGCRLWLDAADGNSISLSGTDVTQWNDKSGNARHLTQTTSGLRPSYSAASNAIVFDGTRYLDIPNALAAITPTYTVFLAEKRASSNARFLVGQRLAVANVGLVLGYNDSNIAHHTTVYISDLMTTINSYSASDPIRVTRYQYTGTTRSTFVNGGEYSNSQSFSNTLTVWSNANVGAGYNTSSTNWYIGNTHEVIFYNSVLSTSQCQQIEAYLAWKWNNTSSLPAIHSFKKFPSSTVTRPNFKELAYTGNDYNVYFAKYSPDGSVLWALRWTATGGISIQDIATDSSGNLYVTGLYVNSSLLMYDTNGLLVRTLANTGDYDGLVAKYTSSGVLLWTSRHTGPVSTFPTGVAVDSSGNVYAGGAWNGASLTIYSAGEASSNTYGTTGGQTDGYIVKYDSSGIVQWSAKIVCSSYDTGGVSLKTDSSGNVYSVGINVLAAPTFYNANGTTGGSLAWGGTIEGAWLAKWNSSGTYQWALRFLTGDLNTGQGALSIDSSGNLYVSAAYDSTLTLKNSGDATAATMTNSGGYDAFLVKYSSAGVYSWNARVGGTGSSDEIANAIDGSGNLYIMGRYTGTIIVYTSGEGSSTTLTNSGGYDNFIAKYTSAGVLSWATRIASTANDTGSALSVDSAGNVYAHGTYEGTVTFFNVGGGTGGTLSNSSADTYLAKYTTSGTFLWAARITGSALEASRRSITDPDGNIYVGGIYNSSPLTLNGV